MSKAKQNIPVDHYSKIFPNTRRDKTSTVHNTVSGSLTSDKNRIIFSTVFRRLQQKAQVFSLETNAAVRSRLTHTLEVATIGISLAESISEDLIQHKKLKQEMQLPFIKIVENACLMHDIGNPPYGHFAEDAIKKWFLNEWEKHYITATTNFVNVPVSQSLMADKLIKDFLFFDGNPQGIRIITKLQTIPGKFSGYGLNLTLGQISALLKYISNPNEIDVTDPLRKKAGYFHSEEQIISDISRELGMKNRRNPMTYIMEAADDISYCLSDIEDGIEKSILTPQEFFDYLNEEWSNLTTKRDLPFAKIFQGQLFNEFNQKIKRDNEDFFNFKIAFVRALIKHSKDRFVKRESEIMNGTMKELIDKNSELGQVLAAIKALSRKHLFRSREAENKELVGYRVIYNILDYYAPLFSMTHDSFSLLIDARVNLDAIKGKSLDFEWRLFNRLPKRHVEAYIYDCEKMKKEIFKEDKEKYYQYEWFYRAHLIVDYISGMTDNYALETYRLLHGIQI